MSYALSIGQFTAGILGAYLLGNDWKQTLGIALVVWCLMPQVKIK